MTFLNISNIKHLFFEIIIQSNIKKTHVFAFSSCFDFYYKETRYSKLIIMLYFSTIKENNHRDL